MGQVRGLHPGVGPQYIQAHDLSIHDICECVAKRVQEEAVDRQQGKAGSRELRTTAASAPPARVEIFTQACCGSSHGPGEGGMERV